MPDAAMAGSQAKAEWLAYFREALAREGLDAGGRGIQKQLARQVNQTVGAAQERALTSVPVDPADPSRRTASVLLIRYAAAVAMLEARHRHWPYEFMSLSRRAGEIWEGMCATPFHEAVRTGGLEAVEPPSYDSLHSAALTRFEQTLRDLPNVDPETADALRNQFVDASTITAPEDVNLKLDMHVKSKEGVVYHIDFKAGMGSAEKGNFLRLWAVGRAYGRLAAGRHQCVLLLRTSPRRASSYLRRLQKSGEWEVAAMKDAYAWIRQLTSFDLGCWMRENVSWQDDADTGFCSALQGAMREYLSWV